MRQSIGATWILQLVIVFMLIFVAFLALTINYTKAFKIKNEVISMIEKYEGVSEGEKGGIGLINNYLKYYNYHTKGTCEENMYGSTSLDSTNLIPTSKGEKYYYCVKKILSKSSSHTTRTHYELNTFFKFNLPFLGDLFTFRVNGVTNEIEIPSDDLGYN